MKSKKELIEKSMKRYIETFCKERRIRRRFAVYISDCTHDFLKQAAEIFRYSHYTTVSSMADAILKHHFESYADLLEAFKNEKNMGRIKSVSESISESKLDSETEHSDEPETNQRTSPDKPSNNK